MLDFSPSVVSLVDVDFFPSSYIVPVVPYNTKKVSHSNMHIESKNQNIKRRMLTKNMFYFIFELKNPRMLILWRKLVVWVKITATLASCILVIFIVA